MRTRNPAVTSPSRASLVVSAVAAIALLGACTNDADDPTPTGSSSASATASATSAFVPSDQSATVLAAKLPAVAASVKGTLNNREVTLNVAQVRAAPHGTVLTYWFTAPDAPLVSGPGEKSWEGQPTLVDATGKKIYEPFTFVHNRGETFCLCTDGGYIRSVPQPHTVSYPALPETVTTIDVHLAGFKDMAIPVTR